MKNERIKTGIEGLDEMLNSGIPKGHVITLIGPTGVGKTTAALQFTLSCLQQDMSCLYITTSQNPESLMRMGNMFGWDFEKYVETGQLTFRLIPPVKIESMPTQRSLSSSQDLWTSHDSHNRKTVISDYLEELPAILMEHPTDAVVIDSVSVFLFLCNNAIERLGRAVHILNLIKWNESTGLVIQDESMRFPEIDCLFDGIIRFERLVLQEKFKSLNIVRIVKMRMTDHSYDIRRYRITPRGIEIPVIGQTY
jgi:circadian clock protein KaiC